MMTRTPNSSILLLLAISLGLGSCATLLNQEMQEIRVTTSKDITRLSIDHSMTVDSFRTRDGEMTRVFDVRRSWEPLRVHLQLDSTGIGKTFLLSHRHSVAYWSNINFNYGVGMLLDRNSNKRFAHPVRNYFYAKDTTIYRRRFAPLSKGTFCASLGLPLINELSLRSPDGQLHTMVAGLEAGLDYFYKQDRYLSLSVGGAATLEPDKISIPVKGTIRSGASFYSSIKVNRVIGSFDIGYGIAFSGMEPRRTDYLHDSVVSTISPTTFAIGPSISLQYRIGRTIRVSALYQPSLWSPTLSPAWRYQHYLAIGVAWRFL